MQCKKHHIVNILVVLLLIYIITKPVILENMSNNEKPIENKFTYGGVNVVYNSDPSDPNFYWIGNVNSQLNVPNSDILVNKNLYENTMTVAPKNKNLTDFIYSDKLMSDLIDNTYCCDNIANKNMLYNYLYNNTNSKPDKSKNRYGTVPESYF